MTSRRPSSGPSASSLRGLSNMVVVVAGLTFGVLFGMVHAFGALIEFLGRNSLYGQAIQAERDEIERNRVEMARQVVEG